jgi:inorganic pyrophosphatase
MADSMVPVKIITYMNYQNHKAHPWHGIAIGPGAPQQITVFIEIVPTDTVKYEIDKESGYLKIDRPQKFSNLIPALYGFIPQTYCGLAIAAYSNLHSSMEVTKGDGDPLDICVLSEKTITHGDIICQAIPIGGYRLIDKGEADDKIIAVLQNDPVYGQLTDVAQCPKAVLDRLRHYFLTYKSIPGETTSPVHIDQLYGPEQAREVILASMADYRTLLEERNSLQ